VVVLKSLRFGGVKVSRRGLAGVRLDYEGTSICIDVVQPERCDYALYTHDHPRHAPAEDWSRVVVSPFRGNRIAPGESIELSNGVLVEAVHAYNLGIQETVKHPRGFGAGYVLEFRSGPRIYHMGDTDLIEEILSVKNKPLDIMLVPVGGDGVMTPEEASEAVKTLRPSIAIPVHWEDISKARIFKRLTQPYTQVVLLEVDRV
jgi:L-ascorbate metabolism protein UlaG (beta-lactamase superfamily)